MPYVPSAPSYTPIAWNASTPHVRSTLQHQRSSSTSNGRGMIQTPRCAKRPVRRGRLVHLRSGEVDRTYGGLFSDAPKLLPDDPLSEAKDLVIETRAEDAVPEELLRGVMPTLNHLDGPTAGLANVEEITTLMLHSQRPLCFTVKTLPHWRRGGELRLVVRLFATDSHRAIPQFWSGGDLKLDVTVDGKAVDLQPLAKPVTNKRREKAVIVPKYLNLGELIGPRSAVCRIARASDKHPPSFQFIVVVSLQRDKPIDKLAEEVCKRPGFSRAKFRRMGQDTDKDEPHVIQSTQSLICPISLCRVRHPVRGDGCVHRSCFDLQTYLELCLSSGIWQCPICSDPVCFRDLHLCNWHADALAAHPNATEVRLTTDGTAVGNRDKGKIKRPRDDTQTDLPDRPSKRQRPAPPADVIVIDDGEESRAEKPASLVVEKTVSGLSPTNSPQTHPSQPIQTHPSQPIQAQQQQQPQQQQQQQRAASESAVVRFHKQLHKQLQRDNESTAAPSIRDIVDVCRVVIDISRMWHSGQPAQAIQPGVQHAIDPVGGSIRRVK